MTLVLDTRDIPPDQRGDAVRETIASTVVHVNIDFAQQSGPQVQGAISDLGQMRVCSIRSNAVRVERTPRLARDQLQPSIFLAVQLAGSSLIVQDGREAVLRPGELAFSESSTPYSLLDDGGIRQHFFSIPISALALPPDAVRRLSATPLSPGHPVADLAAAYFGRLGARPDLFVAPGADLVGRPSIELARALLATHLDASAIVKDSLDTTLSLRIMEYIRAHLGESTLTVARIAEAHSISVRHLYNVLGRDNISPAEWIRDARLEQCRAELARAWSTSRTIAAIARQWGFGDASSFGRLFRERYGLSPQQWRAANARVSPRL